MSVSPHTFPHTLPHTLSILTRSETPIIGTVRSTMQSSCFVFSSQLARYVEDGRRQHMASGQHLASDTVGTKK